MTSPDRAGKEDPRFVFEQLRPLLTSAPADDVDARATRARRGGEAALVKVPFIVRPVLRWLARRAQRNAALREAAKSALMAALVVTRRLALVIGERLAKARLIEDRRLPVPGVEGHCMDHGPARARFRKELDSSCRIYADDASGVACEPLVPLSRIVRRS